MLKQLGIAAKQNPENVLVQETYQTFLHPTLKNYWRIKREKILSLCAVDLLSRDRLIA